MKIPVIKPVFLVATLSSVFCSIPGHATGCSPLLVDLLGNGFQLGGKADYVYFDILGTGIPLQLQWVGQNTADAFLHVDLNGNGEVDDGSELFGVGTDLLDDEGKAGNGYLALSQYDEDINGGNADGVISALDSVWSRLSLWNDSNADGVSQPGELTELADSDIRDIDLNVKANGRKDGAGNAMPLWSWATLDNDKGKKRVKVVDVFFAER